MYLDLIQLISVLPLTQSLKGRTVSKIDQIRHVTRHGSTGRVQYHNMDRFTNLRVGAQYSANIDQRIHNTFIVLFFSIPV